MSYQVHNFQPGDVLLASQLNEMDNQIALNESSSALKSSFANEFSTSSTYAVGDYVIYEGQLYQCTTAVATAGSWNSSNWTQAVLGNDVSDLKSDLDAVKAVTVVEDSTEAQVTRDILPSITWTEGYIMATNSTPVAVDTLKYSSPIAVSEGDVITVTAIETGLLLRAVTAYSNGVAVEESGVINASSYTVPSGIDSIIVTCYISENYRPRTLLLTTSEKQYKNALSDDIDEINEQLDSIADVITTNEVQVSETINVAPSFTTGAKIPNGTVLADYDTFQYTQEIPVSPGDVVAAVSDGSAVPMRWVCALNNGVAVTESGNNNDVYEFTVPDGINAVSVTTRISSTVDTIAIVHSGTQIASYIKPIPMGYMMEQGSLSGGEKMQLPYQNVKINNCYIFNANVTSFSSIKFIKELDTYITVDSTNIVITNDQNERTIPHGLTIGKNITLIIENTTSYTTSLVRVASDGNVFDFSSPVRFIMDDGVPTIESVGSTLTECTFSWVSKNINAPIWLFGDSYFSWYDVRWPYYLVEDGFTKVCMLNGYAGQAIQTAYQALVNLLAVTTPKIVVWCLGMNNPDSESAVSTAWQSTYLQIVELSKKYGFELVLYTVPTTPTMNNRFKDAIIRESGYRYIEADKAVRINENGDWVTGALSTDNVHPTAIGAKILYYRILADLPEIMCDN